MYKFSTISDQLKGATAAQTEPVVRYGVLVYVDTDPDTCSSDFYIDPQDEKGITIFREFAGKMAEHYKTLAQ
jgi:hypothetical protein